MIRDCVGNDTRSYRYYQYDHVVFFNDEKDASNLNDRVNYGKRLFTLSPHACNLF